jgi:threonine synthase
LQDGTDQAQAVTCTTSISGLQVPSVLDGNDVIAACRRSGGTGHLVDDEMVFETQRRLAREEGVFCEPAAAVSVAAALQACRDKYIDPRANVVCLITGSGFKDSPSLAQMAGADCRILDLSGLSW